MRRDLRRPRRARTTICSSWAAASTAPASPGTPRSAGCEWPWSSGTISAAPPPRTACGSSTAVFATSRAATSAACASPSASATAFLRIAPTLVEPLPVLVPTTGTRHPKPARPGRGPRAQRPGSLDRNRRPRRRPPLAARPPTLPGGMPPALPGVPRRRHERRRAVVRCAACATPSGSRWRSCVRPRSTGPSWPTTVPDGTRPDRGGTDPRRGRDATDSTGDGTSRSAAGRRRRRGAVDRPRSAAPGHASRAARLRAQPRGRPARSRMPPSACGRRPVAADDPIIGGRRFLFLAPQARDHAARHLVRARRRPADGRRWFARGAAALLAEFRAAAQRSSSTRPTWCGCQWGWLPLKAGRRAGPAGRPGRPAACPGPRSDRWAARYVFGRRREIHHGAQRGRGLIDRLAGGARATHRCPAGRPRRAWTRATLRSAIPGSAGAPGGAGRDGRPAVRRRAPARLARRRPTEPADERSPRRPRVAAAELGWSDRAQGRGNRGRDASSIRTQRLTHRRSLA